jgi:[ribosomal protein S5]-alanine N-acetyltransferase
MSSFYFPPSTPTLRGHGFLLRELSEADIPSWFERATDAESADLAGDAVPASIEKGTAWLERHRDLFRKKVGLRWSIVPDDSTQSVGTIGLIIKEDDASFAELGIVVARSLWGRGFGSAATRVVSHYAFTELGQPEIRAEVLQRNQASIRLLEKTGFELIRLLPPKDSEPETMLLYSLTRSG